LSYVPEGRPVVLIQPGGSFFCSKPA